MQVTRAALALAAWFLCAVAVAAPPGGATLPQKEWTTIRKVIGDQLVALKAGDGTKALTYAAPGIREQLGTPDNFMRMVREGYGALLHARELPLCVRGPRAFRELGARDAQRPRRRPLRRCIARAGARRANVVGHARRIAAKRLQRGGNLRDVRDPKRSGGLRTRGGIDGARQGAHRIPYEECAAVLVVVEARARRRLFEERHHRGRVVAASRAVGQEQRRHAVVRVARRPIGEAIRGVALGRQRQKRRQAGHRERREEELLLRCTRARLREGGHPLPRIHGIELRCDPQLARIVRHQRTRAQRLVERIDFLLPAGRLRGRLGDARSVLRERAGCGEQSRGGDYTKHGLDSNGVVYTILAANRTGTSFAGPIRLAACA